ncbi:hypothetical protein NBRC10513_007307 [Rhodotorula toruloides]
MAALGGSKSMQTGAAGAQELKKRERSEEKEAKEEAAGAKLAKSGGGSLTTSPSLVGNECNTSITTTTTTSTPTNPFEPVLPPELSDFSIEGSAHDDFGAVLEENASSAGAMHQQAPSNKLHRIDSTPSTGASAPSTSDMILVGESRLSPTLAARRQQSPPSPSLEPSSPFWTRIPRPRPELPTPPTQYANMPIIDFESTASEVDRLWADETKEAFPVGRTDQKEERRESEGEGGREEKWKKVEKVRKGKETLTRTTTATQGKCVGKEGAKGEVRSRARRVAAPAPKEEELRVKEKNLLRLLTNPNSASTDIFLIQETPRDLPAIPSLWRLIIPPPTTLADGEPAPTRNILLLSTRLGPAVATQVAVDSGDVVAINVELSTGETIRVVSMYNPCNNRGKEVRYLPYNHSVAAVLPPLLASTPASSLVVVAGNFNLWHPEWNESVSKPDEAAEEAVRTFSRFNLMHLLAPNTITYHPHNTEHPKKPLDLVLGSLRAEERVVSCGLADNLESGSDHRPIRLILAVETISYTPPSRRAFRRTDPDILERTFLDAVSRLPTSPLLTPVDIDERADQLTDALQIAISAATPFARPRGRAKCCLVGRRARRSEQVG